MPRFASDTNKLTQLPMQTNLPTQSGGLGEAIFGLRSQHQPAATTLSNNSIDTPNPRPAPSSTRNSPSSQWADESSKYLSINVTHEAGTWVGAHLFHLEATGNTGGAKFSRPTPIQLFAR